MENTLLFGWVSSRKPDFLVFPQAGVERGQGSTVREFEDLPTPYLLYELLQYEVSTP